MRSTAVLSVLLLPASVVTAADATCAVGVMMVVLVLFIVVVAGADDGVRVCRWVSLSAIPT